MPTKLGSPYSPLWRGRFPHMLAEDIPVWNKFLDINASLFERIYYDVRVGGIISQDPQISEKMREMYFDVSAKRIDALAELSNELWIVEVAFKPGLRATGQLMTYLALWLEDPKINKPAVAVLVSNQIDSDLKRALDIYGMRSRLVNLD